MAGGLQSPRHSAKAEPTASTRKPIEDILPMPEAKASAPEAQISGARVVPLHIETAKQFGGGARGRTLAIIYRQLCYWSKYAKWKGKNGKKFFYKSAEELSAELSYSTKTIYRAIAALKELGLIVVEKLHKHYWRQVNFFYIPHSPYAAAEPTPEAPAPAPAPEAPARASSTSPASSSTTINPSSFSAAPTPIHPAAAAAATSIKARGGVGFGRRVPIQQREYKPLIKQSLQSVVEKCYAMGEYLKNEQGRLVQTS